MGDEPTDQQFAKEFPDLKVPAAAIALAMEKSDEMDAVIIAWSGKDGISHGMVDNCLPIQDAVYLLQWCISYLMLHVLTTTEKEEENGGEPV